MPPKRRSKRSRSPNVYVQAQREQEELANQVAAESGVDDGDGGGNGQTASGTAQATGSGRRRGAGRSRVGRMTQTTRSDVYAATIPSELRKMGVLAGGVVVALVVFSVLLG